MQMAASSEASVTPPADRKFKVGHRFRGFLPVVVDVETGGFNSQTDALLEIAAVILGVDEHGKLFRRETSFAHVTPFPGANIEKAALDVTRSEERRVGKECVSTCRSRWSQYH